MDRENHPKLSVFDNNAIFFLLDLISFSLPFFFQVVRDVQVLIKCNWKSDFATPKYHKIQTKRHYKFEVESSFGCVKLPHSCVVSSLDNLHYNLTKLSKPNGWKVSNVPKGEIFINICSPLKNLQGACLGNVCHTKNFVT